jgi:hypothetical protein
MWPLDSIRARRRRRRYEVALALLAAEGTYEALARAERTKVEGMVARLAQSAGLFPAEHRRWAPWAQRNAFRAEAMRRLGIAPKGEGVAWPKLVGSARIHLRATLWALDYREGDLATAEALRFLRQKGGVASSNSPNKSLERTREG